MARRPVGLVRAGLVAAVIVLMPPPVAAAPRPATGADARPAALELTTTSGVLESRGTVRFSSLPAAAATDASAAAAPHAPLAAPAAGPTQPSGPTRSLAAIPPFAANNGWGAPNATRGTGVFGSSWPIDSSIAAGTSHTVEVAGTAVMMKGRNGDPEATTLAAFLNLPSGSAASEPDVIYDKARDRFFVAAISLECNATPTGHLELAGSSSGDPTGTWNLFRISMGAFVPELPALGLTSDKLLVGFQRWSLTTLSSNCYGSQSGGSITTLNMDSLVTPGTVKWLMDTSLSVDVLRPAWTSPGSGETGYLVGVGSIGGQGRSFVYGTVTGLSGVGDGITVNLAPLSLLPNAGPDTPPSPHQPGVTLGGFLDWPTDAVWQAGTLFFTSHYGCVPAGDSIERTCVRVTSLKTHGYGAAPDLGQDFLVGRKDYDTYTPAIAISSTRTLFVVYQQSSATQNVRTWLTYQTRFDMPNSLSANVSYDQGASGAGSINWGMQMGAAPDPVSPDGVWVANAVATSGTSWMSTTTFMTETGAMFEPNAPTRVLDTRVVPPATPVGVSGKFTSGTPRWVPLSVPVNTAGVAVNLVAVKPTAAGYLYISPEKTASPDARTVVFKAGEYRSASVTVALSASGNASHDPGVWIVYVGSAGATTDVVMDLQGTFSRSHGDQWFGVTPWRAYDSRKAPATPLASGTPRSIHVAGVAGSGVPSSATAITATITVIKPSSDGKLAADSAVTASPSFTTVHALASKLTANMAFVRLSTSGDLSVVWNGTTGSTANVVIDVTGYFDIGNGEVWVPLAPVRIVDTRPANKVGANTTFVGTTEQPVKVGNRGGVGGVAAPFPAFWQAAAVTGSVTVTNDTADGKFTLAATLSPMPATSTIMFNAGDTRACGIVAGLSSAAHARGVYLANSGSTTATTDVIVYVTGYFH